MKRLGKKSQMEQGTFAAYATCGNCNCTNVCITCKNSVDLAQALSDDESINRKSFGCYDSAPLYMIKV